MHKDVFMATHIGLHKDVFTSDCTGLRRYFTSDCTKTSMHTMDKDVFTIHDLGT